MALMPKAGEISDFWLRLAEMVGEGFPRNNQTAAGTLLGVGQSMITRWKTGKDKPALPRAIDLATKYGVCVEWLLTGRGPKHPGGTTDPDLGRLLEFWDKLLPDTKRNVVGYAILQRSIQTTASAERIKEVHEKLPEANHKARKDLSRRSNRAD